MHPKKHKRAINDEELLAKNIEVLVEEVKTPQYGKRNNTYSERREVSKRDQSNIIRKCNTLEYLFTCAPQRKKTEILNPTI